MPTLLAIDDDRAVLHLVKAAFANTPVSVLVAQDVNEGLELMKRRPDIVLLDIMLPEISGLEGARKFLALDPKLPVIFMTGRGTSEMAIEAMKLGAYDFLIKPLDLDKLRDTVTRAGEICRLMNVPVELSNEELPSGDVDQIVGRSPPMQEVYKAIGRVAPQNITVLIQGESGTGKELVARAIYHHSPRADRQFLAVNCAAIPDSLLESELFGHERGAFTSADSRRIGKFEQCSEGTIFLDEIGDMSPLVQSKVLRVLQEQRFERVGGAETIKTDVRVIVATNRDLKQLANEGKYREDLYYRLNGFTIKLPPLRERGDDIGMLIQYYLQKNRRELGKNVNAIAPETREILMKYSWPGNVRELEAVMRQALLQTTGTVILPEFLPDLTKHQTAPTHVAMDIPASDLEALTDECLQNGSQTIHADATEMMERYVVTRVLLHTNGNQSRAAKLLGITRGSLRKKIRTLHLTLGTTVTPEDDGQEEDVDEHGVRETARDVAHA